MLTDAALKSLKPKAKMYKVSDRDGMYVRVAPSGAISFRLDYRLNGRRETVYLGRYARDGISLARARELCIDARRAIAEGRSPAIEKQREKRRIKEAKSFGEFGEKWLTNATMADSTRAMRRSIFERELMPVWRNRLLTEITPDDLRAHCGKIVERGAPATAIHVRDILKQIYGYAILHGEKVANPADDVGPASIATFTPKDRALSPTEIRIMFRQLEHVATLPTIRLGMKLFLLTMVRKSELRDAVWDEIDFDNAVWSIPKERMKRSKPHNVYLCRQTLDIMIALKTCSGNSRYALSMLGEITKRRKVTVDYQRIWAAQAVDDVLSQALVVIATAVNDDIIRPPQGISNISEWCKREGCWTRLVEHTDDIAELLPEDFWAGLASTEDHRHETKTARQTQKIDNGIELQKQVFEVPASHWSLILKEGINKRLFSPKELGILKIAEQMPTKIPSEKQSAVLVDILGKAQQEGIV